MNRRYLKALPRELIIYIPYSIYEEDVEISIPVEIEGTINTIDSIGLTNFSIEVDYIPETLPISLVGGESIIFRFDSAVGDGTIKLIGIYA